MRCPKCGKEVNQGSNFCNLCGTPISHEQNAPTVPYMTTPVVTNNTQSENIQTKKPVYKKWWFWVIIVLAVFIVVGSQGSDDDNNTYDIKTAESSAENTTEKETEKPTEPPTKKPTEKPTESPAEVEKAFKESCSTIDFSTLARNPEKYKGNNYKFTGQVIQVQEGWFDMVDLRINITKEEFEYIDEVLWTDTIYATVEIPDGDDNILVDDVITFWGTCDGEYTYESVLGSNITLPKIDIEYFELTN